MYLFCTVSETLSVVYQNLNGHVTLNKPRYHFFINLRTKFQMLSLTRSKHTTGAQKLRMANGTLITPTWVCVISRLILSMAYLCIKFEDAIFSRAKDMK